MLATSKSSFFFFEIESPKRHKASQKSKIQEGGSGLRVFVISDNRRIYEGVREILDSKVLVHGIEIDYFCARESKALIQDDLVPIELKSEYQNLLSYDLGFSCHSKQIFPAALVQALPCINLHPGFNPYNRGLYPHVFSMLNHMPAGATIHLMDRGIDTGAVIAQERVDIESSDTSLSLYEKIVNCELRLFGECIDSLLTGSFEARPASLGNYNSLSDFRRLCEIDLDKRVSMKEAIDLLRALSHPPFLNAYFLDSNKRKVFISLVMHHEGQAINGGGGGAGHATKQAPLLKAKRPNSKQKLISNSLCKRAIKPKQSKLYKNTSNQSHLVQACSPSSSQYQSIQSKSCFLDSMLLWNLKSNPKDPRALLPTRQRLDFLPKNKTPYAPSSHPIFLHQADLLIPA